MKAHVRVTVQLEIDLGAKGVRGSVKVQDALAWAQGELAGTVKAALVAVKGVSVRQEQDTSDGGVRRDLLRVDVEQLMLTPDKEVIV